MSFQAVLFDFDGTLADSYAAIAASINHVRAVKGLPPLTAPDVRRHVGRGPEYLLAQTVPGASFERDWPIYRAHHPSVMAAHTHLLPGAAELLALLHERGLRLGVCSNKPRAFTQALIEHFGLAARLPLVLGPEDVRRPKPAPDMLVAALAKLQLSASQVLYVGDMVVDIDTARGAGVAVWVTPTGSDERGTLEAARPDRLLANLLEIAEALR